MAIIIVGGGMAGATLALALSRMTAGRLAVDLVEARTPDGRPHPGYDGRALALADGTCRQLTAIGVWPALRPGASPMARVQVSDRGHFGKVWLDARDYGLDALGYVVELHEAGQRLYELLRRAPGVRLHCPASVASVARRSDAVDVALDNGEHLTGRLLVAADGSRSPTAEQCGITWRQSDYRQLAVIANITTARALDKTAYERFTEHGPLALLPLSAGRAAVVWCLPEERRDEVAGWDDAAFRDALQRVFGWSLGRIRKVGRRQIYPLRLLTAAGHIGHRLALVGNAAQTLHPIAGQGFNLGLRDVMTLAETLAEAHGRGDDPGDYPTLRQYSRRRGPDQTNAVKMTDGLIHVFANDYPALVLARNWGLQTMARWPLLRNVLARRTLGWVER
ncbi:2-octaprenyl-6-methoxyphenyl hydroxylase [Martelella alba]|uniref:2-octaprenyl-6-methoxyphenyl hydroxylase n=1 Tax=Martelella alba TaxID=2590451 RepID=A0ABY2SFK8_9HYPH|nr:2-octaprenyl-6-methoxyphenyl hydroxylase [Martelella alba]TKI03777.1 2-octaprenyl-6-methoxyphenyl hydroxylase [Martelella alba]